MTIGILGCGFACEGSLEERLNPWFSLAKERNLIFSFVSARFKEYEELSIHQDNTLTSNQLIEYHNNGKIQYLYLPKESLTEAQARDLALQSLLRSEIDYVWLLDLSDEYYTIEQINNIIDYIKIEEFITWFSIPFKNYIFDGKSWISGFCPPRIFKVNANNDLKLDHFYWDNDVKYLAGPHCTLIGDSNVWSYKGFANKSIPVHKLNGGIKHLTWLHANGKLKYEYQMKHFGHCGYKWNYQTNRLEFDLEYHKKYNLSLPTVYLDEN